MKNKYKAVPVYYSHSQGRQLSPDEVKLLKMSGNSQGDITRFDSKLEFCVYQVLSKSQIISSIEAHHPLNVLPANQSLCFPNGKKWQVDFLAKGQDKEPLMLVEAKGTITREFPLILALLEKHNPEMFKRLWIVFERIPSNSLLVKALSKNDFPKIITLSQFKSLII